MSTVTTLGVTGMTSTDSVARVTERIETVDRAEHVSIVLHPDAESEVTVFSDEPLDEAALRAAVEEAGYEVASLDVQTDALAAQQAEQAPGKQRAHDDAAHTWGR
ncbi:heavy-metal-associated domain-containing protein [Isoptericola sediminis]|uniref:Heavy-metal-associated domain-containing protein n=1 Tax=Isoptericola sediminis TaxID=2733572 RepID=A0A849K327_9MICO|nr:heavy-metal-associated domain-containing protein [Isoptericola sediminis]NNU26449.1 heavy-metal-associated domain-containing protein [Isoptericola sediminis]